MAAAAEAQPEARCGRSSLEDILDVYRRDVDRGRLREALALTPAQRLAALFDLQRGVETLRAAGRKAFP